MSDDESARSESSAAESRQDATATDRARGLVEGRLSADAAAVARAEASGDPAVAQFAADWALVAELTGAADVVPPCPERVAAQKPTWRSSLSRAPRLAVAAALLAAVALVTTTAAAMLSSRGPSAILAPRLAHLAAAGAEPAVSRASAADLPLDLLADFAPVTADRIAWLTNWDTARAVSAASGKPLLVFVFHADCPLCKSLDRSVWTDGDVRSAAVDFVPVRVDAMDAPERFDDVFDRGWPYIAAFSPDDRLLREFPGMRKPPAMRDEMTAAAASKGPDWEAVRSAARDVRTGDGERAAGHRGAALLAFDRASLAHAGPLSERAQELSQSLEGEARAVLSSVAEIAKTDARSAATVAADAGASFAGSALGEEFRTLAAALNESGKFPTLLEVPR